MATEIFLGEPPANIKQWIIDHATPPGPTTHADTWYKYAGDTEWRTVSISGAIEGSFGEGTPTTQIPNVTNIVALEIGIDVTSIGECAFVGCESLISVTFSNNLTSIGSYSFSQCKGITSIIIPNNVTYINASAFDKCSELTDVTIPDSVINIDFDVFNFCTKLSEVTIVATGKPGASAENVKQMLIDNAGVDENITWNMPN